MAAVLELFRPLTPLTPLSLTFVSEPSAQICRHCSHLHAENLGAFKWVSLAGAKYIKRVMACPAGSRDVSRVSCNP